MLVFQTAKLARVHISVGIDRALAVSYSYNGYMKTLVRRKGCFSYQSISGDGEGQSHMSTYQNGPPDSPESNYYA